MQMQKIDKDNQERGYLYFAFDVFSFCPLNKIDKPKYKLDHNADGKIK